METISNYERMDSDYAVVTGRCGKGIFLRMKQGEEAFSYQMSNLKIGTEVICTVLKMAQEGRRLRVAVDSVVAYA